MLGEGINTSWRREALLCYLSRDTDHTSCWVCVGIGPALSTGWYMLRIKHVLVCVARRAIELLRRWVFSLTESQEHGIVNRSLL